MVHKFFNSSKETALLTCMRITVVCHESYLFNRSSYESLPKCAMDTSLHFDENRSVWHPVKINGIFTYCEFWIAKKCLQYEVMLDHHSLERDSHPENNVGSLQLVSTSCPSCGTFQKWHLKISICFWFMHPHCMRHLSHNVSSSLARNSIVLNYSVKDFLEGAMSRNLFFSTSIWVYDDWAS